jgi:hypothetical protein
MINAGSTLSTRHIILVGLRHTVHIYCLTRLGFVLRCNVSSFQFLSFLHLLYPVKLNLWTTYVLHWKDLTGKTTALNWWCVVSVRWPKYWLGLIESLKLAHRLTHQARQFCSCPLCIAPHSTKSTSILISGYKCFIICLIGALVRAISLLLQCFPAFASFSRYCKNSIQASVGKM